MTGQLDDVGVEAVEVAVRVPLVGCELQPHAEPEPLDLRQQRDLVHRVPPIVPGGRVDAQLCSSFSMSVSSTAVSGGSAIASWCRSASNESMLGGFGRTVVSWA